MVLKDSILNYGFEQIGELEALNITANVADKGDILYKCPKPGQHGGNNIISAMFAPGEQKMFVAI